MADRPLVFPQPISDRVLLQYDAVFSSTWNINRELFSPSQAPAIPKFWPVWDAVPSRHSLLTSSPHRDVTDFRSGCSKSSQRAMDELQRTIIEIETKYKAELSRLKKKYETELR